MDYYSFVYIPLYLSVVVTTCRNSTCSLLTSAKLLTGYLVVGITRELNKEPLLHCSPIYIIQHGPYYNNISISCPITHPPCFYLKATMLYPYALMSYSLISITMYALCIYHKELLFLNIIPNPNSF